MTGDVAAAAELYICLFIKYVILLPSGFVTILVPFGIFSVSIPSVSIYQ